MSLHAEFVQHNARGMPQQLWWWYDKSPTVSLSEIQYTNQDMNILTILNGMPDQYEHITTLTTPIYMGDMFLTYIA